MTTTKQTEAKPTTRRPRSKPKLERTVTTKSGQPGRAKDGAPRFGFTVTEGDVVIFDSGHSYKTEEAARRAGEAKSLAS